MIGMTKSPLSGVGGRSFEKAMSFKDHPDYVDALKELGDDETKVVKRTSCVISG